MPEVTPQTIYIGVDVATDARRTNKTFTFLSLDQGLKLVAQGEGDLEDVVAYVGSQSQAMVAVNAPRRPNLSLVQGEGTPGDTGSPLDEGGTRNCRVAEYQLRQHHIHVLSTSSRRETCPTWVRAGFKLFALLDKLGFSAYPTPSGPRCSLEVSAHAVFCTLLGQAPFPPESVEGRLQRQLVLKEQGLKIKDPMYFFEEVTSFKLLQGILPLDEIYSAWELDALAAAYTAWQVTNRKG